MVLGDGTLAWPGVLWHGMVSCCLVWCVPVLLWYTVAWCGMAWCGEALSTDTDTVVWCSVAWINAYCGVLWHCVVWWWYGVLCCDIGKVWCPSGTLWNCVVWCEIVRYGAALQYCDILFLFCFVSFLIWWNYSKRTIWTNASVQIFFFWLEILSCISAWAVKQPLPLVSVACASLWMSPH